MVSYNQCPHMKMCLILSINVILLWDMQGQEGNKSHKQSVDGVPMSAVELYLFFYPNCITGKKIAKKAKRNSIKFILSTRVGHRCQVDLIDMSSWENLVTRDN